MRAHDGGAKIPTNLSLRADLVRRARELKLNLSELVDRALEREIRDRERADWLAENARAIEDYNARVEERGVFGDDWRSF